LARWLALLTASTFNQLGNRGII